VQKNFETFIGQGEQAQGRSWRLAKGEDLGVCKEKRKEKRRMCVREIVLVLMCGEVLMESVCVGIKHERNLCRKCLWQSLWTFGSISCFSQIHHWICVKIESVLVWKV